MQRRASMPASANFKALGNRQDPKNNKSDIDLKKNVTLPAVSSSSSLSSNSYGSNSLKPTKYVDKYLLMGELGEGAYGKVREAMDSHTLRRVAIKIIKKGKLKRMKGAEEFIKNEIRILKKLHKHKNVIELIDVIENEEKNKLYIVLEFAGRGSLQRLIESSPDNIIPTSLTKRFFRQIIEGLEHIHSMGVIHRDIKPDNLLITTDNVIKISDFGVCQELDTFTNSDRLTRSVGSPAFQAPQIVSGTDNFSGFKLDIWAAGVTLYYMVVGELPFKGTNVYNLMDNIARGEYTIPDWVDPQASSLIRGMLDVNEDTRFSIEQIKNHPFLTSDMHGSDTGSACSSRRSSVSSLSSNSSFAHLPSYGSKHKLGRSASMSVASSIDDNTSENRFRQTVLPYIAQAIDSDHRNSTNSDLTSSPHDYDSNFNPLLAKIAANANNPNLNLNVNRNGRSRAEKQSCDNNKCSIM